MHSKLTLMWTAKVNKIPGLTLVPRKSTDSFFLPAGRLLWIHSSTPPAAPASSRLTRLEKTRKPNSTRKPNKSTKNQNRTKYVEYVVRMQDQWNQPNLKHRICQANHKTGYIAKSCQDGNTSNNGQVLKKLNTSN